MIRNDAELHATQERILLFERILAEARRMYSLSSYAAMAEGYWLVIDELQADIRTYPGQSHQLTRVPWVYHSCFYSVTDSFHFITPELG